MTLEIIKNCKLANDDGTLRHLQPGERINVEPERGERMIESGYGREIFDGAALLRGMLADLNSHQWPDSAIEGLADSGAIDRAYLQADMVALREAITIYRDRALTALQNYGSQPPLLVANA